MKKKILLIIPILLLSGCVKNTNTMTINKNKSMQYESEIIISNSLNDKIENYLDIDKIKKNGFEVTTSKKDNYTGIVISKKYKNIDKLSVDTSEEKIISDFINESFETKDLFKVSKGFFKNTYTAKFTYKVNKDKIVKKEPVVAYETKEDDTSNVENKTETIDETTTEVKPKIIEDDLSELTKAANLESEIELLFKLNLPYESTANNATVVSEDGKSLTWKLNNNESNSISFTFYLLNYTTIYIMIGLGVLLLVGLIFLIKLLIDKKRSKETLIHIDYDQSIAKKVENDVKNSKVESDESLSEDNKE